MAQLRIQRNKTKLPKAQQVIFTSSQTFTIDSKWKSMDIFIVNGGNGGDYGTSTSANNGTRGGNGGGAGYTLTSKDIDVSITKDISVSIGNGGRRGEYSGYDATVGSTTSITIGSNRYSPQNQSTTRQNGGSGAGVGDTAASAIQPGNGGSNGGNGTNVRGGSRVGGTGQGTTTRAFEESSETLYAGAGGAGYIMTLNGTVNNGGVGGPGGGGNGGYNGSNGSDNSGGGGGAGGGVAGAGSTEYNRGGAGGSGIAIIRLYKNSDRPTDIDWTQCTINL